MSVQQKQIFAYTEPTPQEGYAQFLQVFHQVGWTVVTIRDRAGVSHSITIPTAEFVKLQNVPAYGGLT